VNRLAFRGLRERKARTAFTLLAVILGVALIAGTFVLTDTISKSFDRLVAVKVLSRNTGDDFADAVASFPAAVESQVRAVDGVAAAAGAYREASVTLVDDRGERIGPTNGAPTLAFSAVPERFDPFEYEGRPPRADGEIAISTQAAQDAGLTLGDQVRVQGTQNIRSYELVGLTTFGGASSLGGAIFTVFTLPEVQALAGEPGKLTELDVQAEPGVTQAELKRRVSAEVGRTVLVRTGEEDSQAESQDLSEILSFLTIGLLAFGLVALLVGAFVIFNTFTITVAQRTREFGMLRTIGASRRQVL
jgi:putative ABC transport system permease protein